MKSYSRHFICVASLLIAAVLPASAGSTKTYTYNDPVTGITGITGVSTTFTFNSKTDKVSAGTLTFSGVFGGVPGTFHVTFQGLATNCSSSCSYDVMQKVTYEGHTYAINDVINLGQLSASGSIKTGKKTGYFDGPFSTVPEGGSRFSYLGPAGFVIFGAIFLSGVLRPGVNRRERV